MNLPPSPIDFSKLRKYFDARPNSNSVSRAVLCRFQTCRHPLSCAGCGSPPRLLPNKKPVDPSKKPSTASDDFVNQTIQRLAQRGAAVAIVSRRQSNSPQRLRLSRRGKKASHDAEIALRHRQHQKSFTVTDLGCSWTKVKAVGNLPVRSVFPAFKL